MCDGGRITIMKMRKIISVAASAAIAAAAFTTASSAYITEPSMPNSSVVVTNQNWKLVINGSYNVDYTQVGSVQVVAKVTDYSAYTTDLTAGVYSGTETSFMDFQGFIALGANDWFQYSFTTLSDAAGDGSSNAAVSTSADGTVTFTADLLSKEITNEAAAWTAISIGEWGNTSTGYGLMVVSASLFDKSGNLIISFDGNGSCIADNVVVQTEAETTAPETTPETTTTTTAPETTTTTTTTTTAATTTTTTTTTTAAETTTTTTTTTEAETTTTTEEVTTSEETTVEESAEESAEETVEETTVEETKAEETTVEETTTTEAETAETTAAATESEETTQASTAQAAQPASHAHSSSQNGSLMIILIVAGVVILGAVVGIIIVLAKRRK